MQAQTKVPKKQEGGYPRAERERTKQTPLMRPERMRPLPAKAEGKGP